MYTVDEVVEGYERLCAEVDQWTAELWEHATSLDRAEEAYRKKIGEVWADAPPGDVRKGGMSEPERKAWVESRTAEARRVRDRHQALKEAALEVVRSKRAKLSALQSIVAYHREEMGLAKYGPGA